MPDRQFRVALTGATGFIGRQLLCEFADKALQVSALTRQDVHKDSTDTRIHWVTGDLSTPDALARLVEGADCVLHLAGATKALTAGEFSGN